MRRLARGWTDGWIRWSRGVGQPKTARLSFCFQDANRQNQHTLLSGSTPIHSRHKNVVLPFAEFLQSHATVMSCWRPLPHPCPATFKITRTRARCWCKLLLASACRTAPRSPLMDVGQAQCANGRFHFLQHIPGTDPGQDRLVGRAWATAAETSPPAIWLLPTTAPYADRCKQHTAP
jgi:hypothetical protein